MRSVLQKCKTMVKRLPLIPMVNIIYSKKTSSLEAVITIRNLGIKVALKTSSFATVFTIKLDFDEFVKSPKRLSSVIPAQAGIQSFSVVKFLWIPVFTGMTTFYESINFELIKKSFVLIVPGVDMPVLRFYK